MAFFLFFSSFQLFFTITLISVKKKKSSLNSHSKSLLFHLRISHLIKSSQSRVMIRWNLTHKNLQPRSKVKLKYLLSNFLYSIVYKLGLKRTIAQRKPNFLSLSSHSPTFSWNETWKSKQWQKKNSTMATVAAVAMKTVTQHGKQPLIPLLEHPPMSLPSWMDFPPPTTMTPRRSIMIIKTLNPQRLSTTNLRSNSKFLIFMLIKLKFLIKILFIHLIFAKKILGFWYFLWLPMPTKQNSVFITKFMFFCLVEFELRL